MHVPIIEVLPVTRLALAILLHFIWQAALLVSLVAVGLSLIHARYCRFRYGMSVLGLVVILLAPLVTASYYVFNQEAMMSLNSMETELGAAAAGVADDPNLAGLLGSQFQIVFHWFDNHRIFWLGCWLIGFALFVLRLCVSLRHCVRLRRHRQRLPPSVNRLAEMLKNKLEIAQEIIIGCSHEVTQAVATGIIKPVILIPTSWVTQLPISAIEAILAHELAHVKRWDLWVNLLQRFSETLFFFHPAVWWLSQKITCEREVCCDQMAVRVTGQPMCYVQTLAQVAGRSTLNDFKFQFGNAFTGGKNMNLLHRAKLILEPESLETHSSFRTLTFFLCLGLLVSYGSYAYCTTPDPALASIQDRDHADQGPDGKLKVILVQEDDQESHQADTDHRDHLSQLLHEHLIQLLHENTDPRELAQKLRAVADHLEADDQDLLQHHGADRSQQTHGQQDLAIDVEVIPADDHSKHRIVKVKPNIGNLFFFRQSDKPQEMIIEVEADGNENEQSRNNDHPHPMLQARQSDPRQNVFVEKIHVDRSVGPHGQDDNVRIRGKETPDGELGRAIRDLKNEVQQLRRELNQLRSDRNPQPNRYTPAHPQAPRRQTDRDGRFGRDDNVQNRPPQTNRWIVGDMKQDNDSATDDPSRNIWIDSGTGNIQEFDKIRYGGQSENDDQLIYRFRTYESPQENDRNASLLWVEENDDRDSADQERKRRSRQPDKSKNNSNPLNWLRGLSNDNNPADKTKIDREK